MNAFYISLLTMKMSIAFGTGYNNNEISKAFIPLDEIVRIDIIVLYL
jgi:hypothetical protein